MTVRTYFVFSLLVILLVVLLPGALLAGSPCTDKKIIGQECWTRVEELGLDFLARVDTGSTTTSLHATNIVVAGGSSDPIENIGRRITFQTVSTTGESRKMTAEIARIQTVVNAQGREKRYMVWLTLTGGGISKKVLINLRDRSHMRYKMLVGRDWLADDFLVDVNSEEELVAIEGEEE